MLDRSVDDCFVISTEAVGRFVGTPNSGRSIPNDVGELDGDKVLFGMEVGFIVKAMEDIDGTLVGKADVSDCGRLEGRNDRIEVGWRKGTSDGKCDGLAVVRTLDGTMVGCSLE